MGPLANFMHVFTYLMIIALHIRGKILITNRATALEKVLTNTFG